MLVDSSLAVLSELDTEHGVLLRNDVVDRFKWEAESGRICYFWRGRGVDGAAGRATGGAGNDRGSAPVVAGWRAGLNLNAVDGEAV